MASLALVLSCVRIGSAVLYYPVDTDDLDPLNTCNRRDGHGKLSARQLDRMSLTIG